MNNALLPLDLNARIADLYNRMEESYNSYFQHHTYIEWAYLWEGLNQLDKSRRVRLVAKARANVTETEKLLARGTDLQVMCPLNEAGRCTLYNYRLMICRMHGVPAFFTLPSGVRKDFPGCPRCQLPVAAYEGVAPAIDRTTLYQELAQLEQEFRSLARQPPARVKLTLSQMIVIGPPKL